MDTPWEVLHTRPSHVVTTITQQLLLQRKQLAMPTGSSCLASPYLTAEEKKEGYKKQQVTVLVTSQALRYHTFVAMKVTYTCCYGRPAGYCRGQYWSQFAQMTESSDTTIDAIIQ
jgi:hypothetical protein